MKGSSKPSLGAQRYLWRFAERGISREQILADLKDVTEYRNVENYLTGGTQGARSRATYAELIKYAQTKSIKIDRSFFDIRWHPSIELERFVSDNRQFSGILEHSCGKFVYVVEDQPSGLRIRNLSIHKEDNGLFRVKVWGGRGRNYAGFALCADNIAYILVFDESKHSDVATFMLRPVDSHALPAVAFVGVQTCTFPADRAKIASAGARRTFVMRESDVHITVGANAEIHVDPTSLPAAGLEWLGRGGTLGYNGFVVDLTEHEDYEE